MKKAYDEFFREEMKKAPLYILRGGTEGTYSGEGLKFTRDMRKKLVEKGWYVQHWPKEYGGRNAPLIEQLIFNESMGYFGVPGIEGFGVRMFGPPFCSMARKNRRKGSFYLSPEGRFSIPRDGVSRMRVRTWLHSKQRPSKTANITSSTGKKPGPRGPTRPTTCFYWPGPTRLKSGAGACRFLTSIFPGRVLK